MSTVSEALLAARETIDCYMEWRISDGEGISGVEFPTLGCEDAPL
jgi:hypothetical protein